ncbi:MAG: P-loop NTPase fold protein [Candidatus Eremiobacterota bacterium]
MWHDNETSVDLLGFNYLVNLIIEIINNKELLPCTIGVYGDWGSGKSSLLKMIHTELKKNKNDGIFCINFNGWLFEGYEDAKVALMGTILEKIQEKRTLTKKAKDLLGNLLVKIDWIKLGGILLKHAISYGIMGPVGLGMAGISDLASILSKDKLKNIKIEEIEEVVKLISNAVSQGKNLRKGIREFHNDFGNLLEETSIKTLVIFIDDLDRCNPDTIIETLEAIRLFLFVERTVFIIGADERLVKYAVIRRFPDIPGEKVELGRDYLEKLIQFPIRIPILNRIEIETYINLLFSKLKLDKEAFDNLLEKIKDKKSSYKIAFNYGLAKKVLSEKDFVKIQEELSLTQQISSVLTTGLNGNPRQCKRFLNTLLMRITMAKAKSIDLEKPILAKLMLLEYFKSEWFKILAEIQAYQEGCPEELNILEAYLKVGAQDKMSEKEKEIKEKFEKIDNSLQVWVKDDWMKLWIVSEPLLVSKDLRAYFYFSRDSLGNFSGAVQRMSPEAQEILNDLLSKSDLKRNKVLTKVKNMSQSDASTIFEAIMDRVRIQEDVLVTLMNFVEERKELLGQLLTFLADLPENKVSLEIVPRLLDLIKGNTVFKMEGQKLLKEWSNSKINPTLAKIAQRRLTV